jgi:trehalose-phosphatase
MRELPSNPSGVLPPETFPPNALKAWASVRAELSGRRLAVFLDYDGTLTPIVHRPEAAVLAEPARGILRRLAARWPTAIVSGRARADVAARVALDEVGYAGSHGFDIVGPGAARPRLEVGADLVPTLAEAAGELRRRTADIPGVLVEEKGFSVALHYRLVDATRVAAVEQAFEETFAARPGLRRTAGKKVLELRPALDWDKGCAVVWMLEHCEPDPRATTAVYIGDDVTDEDAFRALGPGSVTVVVTEEPRPTAARYSLRDSHEVGGFLTLLAGLTP